MIFLRSVSIDCCLRATKGGLILFLQRIKNKAEIMARCKMKMAKEKKRESWTTNELTEKLAEYFAMVHRRLVVRPVLVIS